MKQKNKAYTSRDRCFCRIKLHTQTTLQANIYSFGCFFSPLQDKVNLYSIWRTVDCIDCNILLVYLYYRSSSHKLSMHKKSSKCCYTSSQLYIFAPAVFAILVINCSNYWLFGKQAKWQKTLLWLFISVILSPPNSNSERKRRIEKTNSG